MKLFIAVETASGDIYQISAMSPEAAYRNFGEEILGMDMDADSDIGDVDIDLYEVSPLRPKCKKLELLDAP